MKSSPTLENPPIPNEEETGAGPESVEASTRLLSIQALRGIAASLVVFHHYSEVIRDYSTHQSWIVRTGLGSVGAAGVDLFFVISGFIMAYTTTEKMGLTAAGTFLKKRITRIVPLYWFWSSALLLLWLSGLALKSHHFTASYIVRSYLMIPCYNGKDFEPLLGQGWTLSYEMFFYAVFSVAILSRLRRFKTALLFLSFALLAQLGRFLPSSFEGLRRIVSEPIIAEFLLGVLSAELILWRQRSKQNFHGSHYAAPLATIGFFLLFLTAFVERPPSLRLLEWGVPSFLIVTGFAALRSNLFKPTFIYLGDASYSVYLSHGFFFLTYGALLKHAAVIQQIEPDLAIAIGSLITIPLASLAYPLVEQPLTALVKSAARSLAAANKRAPA